MEILLAKEQQLLEGSINQKYEIATNMFYIEVNFMHAPDAFMYSVL